MLHFMPKYVLISDVNLPPQSLFWHYLYLLLSFTLLLIVLSLFPIKAFFQCCILYLNSHLSTVLIKTQVWRCLTTFTCRWPFSLLPRDRVLITVNLFLIIRQNLWYENVWQAHICVLMNMLYSTAQLMNTIG